MQKIVILFCYITAFYYCSSQPTGSQSIYNRPSVAMPPGREMVPPELVIYPNPARNKITVKVKNFDPGMASVKLLDTKGKLVRQDNRLLVNGTEEIVMFLMLKEGIYFIIVSGGGKFARKKLVIY